MTLRDNIKSIITKMRGDMMQLENQVTTTPAGEMCVKNILGRLEYYSNELEKNLDDMFILDDEKGSPENVNSDSKK